MMLPKKMAENNQPLGGAQIQPGAQPQGQNPLAKHFRQPKIFIQLPAGGKWWPAGSIDMPENGGICTVKDINAVDQKGKGLRNAIPHHRCQENASCGAEDNRCWYGNGVCFGAR